MRPLSPLLHFPRRFPWALITRLFFFLLFFWVFAQFNVLWLDPTNPDAFPDGLVEAMVEMAAAAAADADADAEWGGSGSQGSIEERLRAQMQVDALRPLGDGDDEDLPKKADASVVRASLPPRTIEDTAQFLRLDVSSFFFCLLLALPFPRNAGPTFRSSFFSLSFTFTLTDELALHDMTSPWNA